MNAEEFKAARKETGLGQVALADRLGLSRQAVARYESGERTAPPEIVTAMSELARNVTDPVTKSAPVTPGPVTNEQIKPEIVTGNVTGFDAAKPARAQRVMNGWQPLPNFDPTREGEPRGKGHEKGCGLIPWPVSNGPAMSWADTREVKPPWKRVPGCCRVVHESIPDPIPFYGPHWAGEQGVPTKTGLVYYATTGMRMKDFNNRRELGGENQGHALVGERPFIPNADKPGNAMPARGRDK